MPELLMPYRIQRHAAEAAFREGTRYDASQGKGLLANELKLIVTLQQILSLFGFMCH